MNKTMFWAVLATVVVGSMLTTQSLLIDAQNEDDIETLKQKSLSDGKIFDDYLIPYSMSNANIEYFGGLEQANAGYNHFNELLEDSKSSEYMSERNNIKMKLANFRTLTDTTEPASKIAALVLQERIQEGKYQQPELEPLKILHKYLIDEHSTTDAGEILTEMFGEMKILTPEVFDLVEKSTLLGNFPSTELVLGNMDYWITVRHYGDCVFVEESDDCDKYLEEAKELSLKKSSNDDASDAPFDESFFPASPNAYSYMDYLAEVYAKDCAR